MKRILIGAMAALLMAAVMSFAQNAPQTPGPMGMGMGMGPRMAMDDDEDDDMVRGPGMRCLMGLDLNDEQEAKLAVLQRDHQRKMLEMQSDLSGLKGKMMLLITDDSFSKKKVEEMIEKGSKSRKEMALERVLFMRAIRDMLNADQKILFDRNIMMAHKGGHGMGGPGMGAGMGAGKGCGMGPCGKGGMDGSPRGCRRR